MILIEEKVHNTIVQIFDLNPSNVYLSGSFALKFQGYKLRREPVDIDILIDNMSEFTPLPGMTETGAYDHYYCEDEDCFYETREWVVNGIKIDTFQPFVEVSKISKDKIFISKEFPSIKMLAGPEIMKFKIQHTFGNAESWHKHRDDLIHILINRSNGAY